MNARRDYERSDISVRGALLAIAIGSLALAIIAAILWLMTRELSGEAGPRVAEPVPALQPQPRRPPLQADPQADLSELQAQARARLEGSGWVDRDRGVAHIPIQRAMSMLAEEGWPEGAP